MQAEETRLHGHHHFITGFECVEGDQTNTGRAIDDRPLIGAGSTGERFGETIFATVSTGKHLLEG